MKWCVVLTVAGVDVTTKGYQTHRDVHVTVLAGDVKRCLSLVVLRINIPSVLDECIHYAVIAVFGGPVEWRAASFVSYDEIVASVDQKFLDIR